MNKSKKKIKIGLIVDEDYISKYVYEINCWAKEQKNLEVSTLIVQKIKSDSKVSNIFKKIAIYIYANGVVKLFEKIGFFLIQKIELHFLKKTEKYKDHLANYFKLTSVEEVIEIKPIISKSGFVYRYSEKDVEKIKKNKLDILIRCGTGILRGDILNAAKHGIISFHHGNNNINRGGPAGFWEVFFRQDSTGFIIQKLKDELDGGGVLFRGSFPTQNYYLLNQAYLYTKSNVYMKKILKDLADYNTIKENHISLPYYNGLFKTPKLKIQIFYICKLFNEKILKKIYNSFPKKKYDQWGVAYQYSSWQNLVMWKGIKINNPSGHFLADPFVIKKENEHYCFVEDYDFAKGKGSISLYAINKNNVAKRYPDIIVEPFHMSYPYVFEFNSKYYLVPETSTNKDIRLYEAVEFPFKWKFYKKIFEDIDAADTTIFEYNKIWWLFTNIDPLNSGDHCSELSIFYSENPLSDCWVPHPKNPVICNSETARMGGIIIERNNIYRVSQKQGFSQYGKSSNINKIIILSKTEYLEELQIIIKPNFYKNIHGTHHLNSDGELTVYDFVKKSAIV